MKKTLPIFLTTILLFVFSCSPLQKPVVPIFQPPEFSFVPKDINDVDEKYIGRMKKYDRIMSTSPIPVYVIDVEIFKKDFPTKSIVIEIKPADPNDPNSIEILDIKVTDVNLLGAFMYRQKKAGWPETFIFINNSLKPSEMISAYAHEIGHYEHKKNECLCMSGLFPIMAEEHAFIHELKMGWKYDDPPMLKAAVRVMGTYIVDENSDSLYRNAVINVMKTEIFKKTMAYLLILEGINEKISDILIYGK